MYSLRRWWGRYGLTIGLGCLALGITWTIRQTQGMVVLELYRWLSYPFQNNSSQQAVLVDARIQELQQQLVELDSQNQQLRKMLDYVASRPEKGKMAPVIGRSADHWWQQITIGRGSQDGIEVGFVVCGAGGIVGRITYVSPHTSRVLLISDPSSQVGVTIARSRFMGYMRGQAEGRTVMEFFDKVPDVHLGDVVTTSSFSQLFPAGLPVGRVTAVDLSKSPAPEAIIDLNAPISRLEWVTIYPNPKIDPADLNQENPGERKR